MRVLAIMGEAARIGVLKGMIDRLIDDCVPFDAVVGTSSGSLVGAAYAHWMNGNDRPLREMGKLLLSPGLEARVMKKPRFHFMEGLNFVSKGGLWDHSPLLGTIKDVIGSAPPNFRCVATNLRTGQAEALVATPKALQASCTIPGLWPPVLVGGDLYADGGLRDNAPVNHAVRMGATHITVLLSKPLSMEAWAPSKKVKGLDNLLRTQEIIMHNALMDDLRMTDSANSDKGRRWIDLEIVEPADHSGGMLDFSVEHQMKGIRIGYAAARRNKVVP